MTQGPKKDPAHSLRQRLQQIAKTSGRPFQEIFQYFVMERFLYRVSRSRHADKFVLYALPIGPQPRRAYRSRG